MPRPNLFQTAIDKERDKIKAEIDRHRSQIAGHESAIEGHESAIETLQITESVIDRLAKNAKTTNATETTSTTATTTAKPKTKRKKGTTPQSQSEPTPAPAAATNAASDPQTTYDIEPDTPAKHNYKCPDCAHEFDAPMQFTDGPHCPKCEKPFKMPTQ